MIIVLREKYLHQSTRETNVAMVGQRSGRMLSVGAKRLPSFGGPLATLAIAILATLAIKYVKRLIRAGSSAGRAALAPQGRSEVRPPSGPRSKTPSMRGVVTITETAVPAEGTTPAAAPSPETTDRLNKLALEQYDKFVKLVHNEAESRVNDGYVTVNELNEQFKLAKLPPLSGNVLVELTIPVSMIVTHQFSSNPSRHQEGETARDYLLRQVNNIKNDLRFGKVVGEAVVDVDNIKGLPGDGDQDDYVPPTTADDALARIDAAKKLLIEWVRDQLVLKRRWCKDGAASSLRRATVGDLGRRDYYVVTRETAAGTAKATVDAYSPEQAVRYAEISWKNNGVVLPSDAVQWAEGSTATAVRQKV